MPGSVAFPNTGTGNVPVGVVLGKPADPPVILILRGSVEGQAGGGAPEGWQKKFVEPDEFVSMVPTFTNGTVANGRPKATRVRLEDVPAPNVKETVTFLLLNRFREGSLGAFLIIVLAVMLRETS